MKKLREEQIEQARAILKRGIELLVDSHTERGFLKPHEIELMDTLSNLTVDVKELEGTSDFDILSGLQYLYDEQFKGDTDFYPTREETRKILDI